jgi:hypothetical protein
MKKIIKFNNFSLFLTNFYENLFIEISLDFDFRIEKNFYCKTFIILIGNFPEKSSFESSDCKNTDFRFFGNRSQIPKKSVGARSVFGFKGEKKF